METRFEDLLQQLLKEEIKGTLIDAANKCLETYKHLEMYAEEDIGIADYIQKGLRVLEERKMDIINLNLQSNSPLLSLKEFKERHGLKNNDDLAKRISASFNILQQGLNEAYHNPGLNNLISLFEILKEMFVVLHIYWNILVAIVVVYCKDEDGNPSPKYDQHIAHLDKLIDENVPTPYKQFKDFLNKCITLENMLGIDMVEAV